MRGAVAELLRKAGVARSTLWAVGVGSPGIVEADGEVRLSTALPGWTGLPLGERLQRSFRCPVLVENDANVGRGRRALEGRRRSAPTTSSSCWPG